MSLRLIAKFAGPGSTEARVYRDAEWDEFRVRTYRDGFLQPLADYCTDDKGDALATAEVIARTGH